MRLGLATCSWGLAALALGCSNPDGRVCVQTSDCGGRPYICRYPSPGQFHTLNPNPALVCNATGVCTRIDTSCGPDWWDSATNGCGCDGHDYTVPSSCPSHPLLGIGGGVSCSCGTVSFEAPVHPGPRQPTEYCPGFDGWLPASCCECVNLITGPATPVPHHCPTSDSRHVPDGCCACFEAAAPDPAGRCVPPGGVYPATGWWCCPNPNIIQTTTVDAGTMHDAG